jgi:hypothetical protein
VSAPSIPAWELADLDQLSAQGDLDGLNPIILASIDQAESSGEGGSVNPEGYGGFFGLSKDATYPGGATTPQLLEGTDSASFEQQAEIAASAFNEYLGEADGNPEAAEEIYQTGSASGPTEGSKILEDNLGTASPGGGGAPATLSSLNANPFDLFGITSTATSGVESFIVDTVLVVAGLAIIVFGVTRLASGKLEQSLPALAEA